MSIGESRGQRRAAGSTPAGRRARQAQAARRRRLGLALGGAAAGLVIVIIAVTLLLNRQADNSATGLVDASKLSPASALLPLDTQAPDFDLTTVDGQHYRLSDTRGHPTLLEFFAVWCPHCQREAAILTRIERNYASKGVRALAVLANPYGPNYDTSQGQDLSPVTAKDVHGFANTFAVTHPILIDPAFATVNRYGAGSYPTFYVLDTAGRVRFAQAGEVPYQQLASALTAAGKG